MHARTSSPSLLAAILIGIAASIFVVAAPAVAQGADATPSIAFVDSAPLALSTTAAATAELVNNSANEWTVQTTAYLSIVGGKATHINLDVAGPKTLGAAGSISLAVAPVASGVGDGSGFVVVTATSGATKTVARRSIAISAATPAPATSSWSGSSSRLTLTNAASGMPALPLDQAACGSLAGPPQQVFVSAGSHIAPLMYRCVDGVPGQQQSTARLLFDASHLTAIGQYKGTLKIGDDSVDLSYLRTRSIFWALLVILFGVGAGVLRQVWVSVIRPLNRLDQRLTLIGRNALSQQTTFENGAGTDPYRHYDFVPGVAAEVARLQTTLGALRPRGLLGWTAVFGWAAGEAQDRYDAVVDDAAKLDSTVTQWPALADDLRALTVELGTLGDDAELAPFLVQTARRMVAPSDAVPATVVLDIVDARALVDATPRTTTALALVPVAAKLHYDVTHIPIPQGSLADVDVLAEAKRLDRQARAELALADDADAVEKAKVDSLLEQARALVLQLKPEPDHGRLQSFALAGGAAPEEGVTGFAVGLFARVQRVGGALSSVSATRGVDLVWLVIATLIAVWSGLALYYFDQPWGRWTDVVVLLVWAFATTSILTPVMSALEAVAAGPMALKKSTAAAAGTDE